MISLNSLAHIVASYFLGQGFDICPLDAGYFIARTATITMGIYVSPETNLELSLISCPVPSIADKDHHKLSLKDPDLFIRIGSIIDDIRGY